MPRLVVGELDVGELAGRLHARRSVRHEPRLGTYGADRRVPVLPQLGQARDAPLDEGPTRRIAPIRRPRQIAAGCRAEVLLTVDAIAVPALRGPAVCEDAVHGVLRYDFAVHAVDEVEVVRAERARNPQLGIGPVAARLSIG